MNSSSYEDSNPKIVSDAATTLPMVGQTHRQQRQDDTRHIVRQETGDGLPVDEEVHS